MAIKMTYADALDIAIANITDETVIEKLNALKVSLSKKNSHKNTKKQDENAKIKEYILDNMNDDTYYTITDMIRQFDDLHEMSNQRISALVSQLVNEDEVTRVMEKRKAMFIKK